MIPGGLGKFLPRLSLGRPIGVIVVVGAVLVMGLVAALSLPIELIPSGYSSPFLRVTVPWRDAPPQELLDKITIPLEEELATVRGLENQFSFCAVGFTQVFLSFAHGTDMDVAYREVRDRIERARARMPDDVEQVLIRKDDDAMMPVAMVGLIVEEETADVYNLVQNEVILKLERVPGVASVDAQGLLEREVLIELDRQRVEAAGLNIFEIAQDLASDYFTLASGNVRAGDRKLLLRSVARYPAPQNVRDMWITDTVRLGDIASIRYDVPDDEFRVRVNGLPAYAIQVQKEGEANALEVAGEVERLVKELAQNPRLAALEVDIIMSSGEIIRDSMGVLLSSGRIGAIFAMIVLFFFLRRLRMSLIIAFSIPLSMVAAVVAMYFFGETFNVISLLGLMISVGLLVDNSVVVAENIHRLHQSGVGRRQAALQGAGEIALAITTATLTTVIVFLPVSLVDGQGQFMLLRLVIPITVSLLASLVVALVVVPLMVYVTLPSQRAAEKGALRQVRDASNVVLRRAYEATFGLLNRAYRGMLGYGLRRRLDVVLALVAALALTQFAARGRLEVVPMSEDDQAFFNIEVRLPRNMSFDETIEYFARAEEKIDGLRDELGLEYLVFFHERTWGQIQGIMATDVDTGLKPREVTQRVLDLMPEMPGVRFHTGFASEQETTDKALETLTLFGEDADVLEEVASGIEDRLVRVPGVLAVKKSADEAPNELALVLDRDRAMRQQVNPRTLAVMVGYALRGQALPRIYYGGQDIPVRIRFEEQDRQSLAELRDFSVPTETGETLAIGTLVDVRQQPAATRISRRDKQTARRITLELEEGRESEARRAVRAVAAQTELPEGVAWAPADPQRGRGGDPKPDDRGADVDRLRLPAHGLPVRELPAAVGDPDHDPAREHGRNLDPCTFRARPGLPGAGGLDHPDRGGREQRHRAARLGESPAREWHGARPGPARSHRPTLPADHDDRADHDLRHGAVTLRSTDADGPELQELRPDADWRHGGGDPADPARGAGLLHPDRGWPRLGRPHDRGCSGAEAESAGPVRRRVERRSEAASPKLPPAAAPA